MGFEIKNRNYLQFGNCKNFENSRFSEHLDSLLDTYLGNQE